MAITYSNLDRFAQPALGRHESYTVRALNLTLLEVEDAPVKGKGQVEGGELVTEKIKANHLPLVYIDGTTMMERVDDFTLLKRGDHICVGLNPMRKIFTAFDKLLQYMVSGGLGARGERRVRRSHSSVTANNSVINRLPTLRPTSRS